MGHLSPRELLDLAETARADASAPHLAVCDRCREELENLRATLLAVTRVEVQEPSPLFWEHLSARVRESVLAEESAGRARWNVSRFAWRLAATVSAAAVVIIAGVMMRTSPTPATDMTPAALVDPATDSGDIVALSDDPSLSLLADLSEDLDWEAATEAGLAIRTGMTDRALTDLTGEERQELHRILNEEMAGQGA